MATEKIVPSEVDLLLALKIIRAENPDYGTVRLAREIAEQRSEWAVSDARLRKVLKKHDMIITPSTSPQPSKRASRIDGGSIGENPWSAETLTKLLLDKVPEAAAVPENVPEAGPEAVEPSVVESTQEQQEVAPELNSSMTQPAAVDAPTEIEVTAEPAPVEPQSAPEDSVTAAPEPAAVEAVAAERSRSPSVTMKVFSPSRAVPPPPLDVAEADMSKPAAADAADTPRPVTAANTPAAATAPAAAPEEDEAKSILEGADALRGKGGLPGKGGMMLAAVPPARQRRREGAVCEINCTVS
ncbi:hypothetical protein JKP88DRAFT_348688 [Tribonema minus]|uniref:Uncharacterized protein n=1 Tax=Tribonema minus TaxID=303371 RepID=A0A835YWB8_9STRA|nr:hypothetical protein JKP88DRAFT_348688 [Tribonema minus]